MQINRCLRKYGRDLKERFEEDNENEKEIERLRNEKKIDI